MTVVHVRPAEPADGPQLARLRLALLRTYESPPDDPDFLDRFARWWSGGGHRFRAVVASAADDGPGTAGGRILGNVWWHPVPKVPRPGGQPHWGYVTNVYVEEDQRGRGLGQRLLDAALRAARAEGLTHLVVWPAAPSAGLYRRAGFDSPAELLELPLPRSADGAPAH